MFKYINDIIEVGRKGDAPVVGEQYQDLTKIPPIPWNTEIKLEGFYRLRAYMKSTAGGGARWYFAGINSPDMYQTLGLYNPKISAVLKNPTIYFNNRFNNKISNFNRLDEINDQYIKQEFAYGYNQFTAGWIITFDEIRPHIPSQFLYRKIKEVENKDPAFSQGHLNVYRINIDSINYQHTKTHRKEFFNHQIYGGKIIDVISVEEEEYPFFATAYALVQPINNLMHIVSPDHMDEGLTIGGGGLKILEHPLPHDDVVD